MDSNTWHVSEREDDWEAPPCGGPLFATVVLPGSKSQTSRALVIGTIAKNPMVVTGALASRDTLLASRAMRAFGTDFTFAPDRNEMTIITRGTPRWRHNRLWPGGNGDALWSRDRRFRKRHHHVRR